MAALAFSRSLGDHDPQVRSRHSTTACSSTGFPGYVGMPGDRIGATLGDTSALADKRDGSKVGEKTVEASRRDAESSDSHDATPDRTARADPVATPHTNKTRIGWALATAVSLGLVVAAQVWQLGEPSLPGHVDKLVVVGFVSGILEWLALLGAVGTLGSLLAVALGYRHPGRGTRWRLTRRHYDMLTSAARWALAWGLSSLVLVVFNGADANGVPLDYVLGGLGTTLVSTQSAQAWLVTAATALLIALGCWLARSWRLVVGMVILAVLAMLPTVVTTQVSVGADHDLATDAAIMFTLAAAWWFGATWAAVRTEASIESDADDEPAADADASRQETMSSVVLRRARWAGLVGVLVAVPSRAGVGAFEQAGQLPWKSAYGLAVLALLLILVVLGIRMVLRWRGQRRTAESSRTGMAGDLALIIIAVGLQAAMWRVHPARYQAAQTSAENFLGYNVAKPPPLAEFLLPGRPNLLLTVTAVVAIALYLWGVARLRKAGDSWSNGRVAGWLVGWVMMLILLDSKMWQYSSATFGWHMVVHMIVNMGIPVLLVLGGPITLLFRSTRATQPGQPAGIRDMVSGMLDWRLVHFLLNPLLIWVIFIGSLYALYLTPLFGSAMRYHWAHQLMLVHFVVIGYLFNWLVIGIDRAPKPLPYVARLGYVFAAMPFHAFFAVALLAGGAITGANFFHSLHLNWLDDLARQQQIGGQITWATSEIPLFALIIALVWQWFRQDQREARRKDRAIDSGHDDSLEAYNQMLAALAQRDQRSQAPQQQTSPAGQDADADPNHRTDESTS